MRIVQSESTEMPLEIDDASSSTTVYVRDHIEQAVEQNDDGERSFYRYEEKQYGRLEWEMLQMAKHAIELEYKLVLLETQGGII